MRRAALDLGSNSFHLLVADVHGRSVAPVLRRREMLRLGRVVASTGSVPDDARERAVSTAASLARLAREHGAVQVIAAATAALRDAANGAEVVAALAEAVGGPVRTLTGPEEAELAYLGVRATSQVAPGPLLVLDLGGGSLELAVGDEDRAVWTASVPLGASALSSAADGHDGLAALHARIDAELDPLVEVVARHAPTSTVAVGGTVRTLARVVVTRQRGHAPDDVPEHHVPVSQLHEVRDVLLGLDTAGRAGVGGMDPERADHAHVAAVVLARVADRLGITELTVSGSGLREGLLLSAPTPATGARPRYVRRVTPAHVRERVSVRHLVEDPGRGPVPTDVVGRLLAMDDDALLIVGRDGLLRVVDATSVLSSRVLPPHPRLPAEPDVGTRERPLVRSAARALVVDPRGRVLLVAHAPERDAVVWTAPGGGLEAGEGHVDAARRELVEEIGLDAEVGPWIWRRREVFTFRGVWIDQEERWFLVRADDLDAAVAPLTDPGTLHARWWTVDELRASTDQIAPASLADHLQELVEHGPPDGPVDVGR